MVKRLATLVLALASAAFAQQVNTDIIPASPGLNLGHTNQRWNANLLNLDISGNCTVSGAAKTCFFDPGQSFSFSGNNTFTGSNLFNGPANTFSGSATNFNGPTFFTSNTIFSSVTDFTSTVNFTGLTALKSNTTVSSLNNIVAIDGLVYSCDDIGLNSAMAVLTGVSANGGTLDARGCISGITISNPVQVGAPNKPVRLLFDGHSQTVTINVTGGATTDVFPVADQSYIDCGNYGGLPAGASYEGAIRISNSANIRAVVAPLSRTGNQNMMGIVGCQFIGSPSMTVASAILDYQGVFANSFIKDTNVWLMYNTIGILLQPGTGGGAGISDVILSNVQANGIGATGSRPCVFNGNGTSHFLGGITVNGGSCQHAAPGNYELEINGRNGGTGGGGACSGIHFYGTHIERLNGSLGINLADCRSVSFDNITGSGGTAVTNFITISESAANVTQSIAIRNAYSSSNVTNWVGNSASTGINIANGAQGFQTDYYFRNATNQIITTSFTTTAAASDNVTVTGMTASGHCYLTATNSGAAGGIASVFVSAKTTNQITVSHTATSGWTFDVVCTVQ